MRPAITPLWIMLLIIFCITVAGAYFVAQDLVLASAPWHKATTIIEAIAPIGTAGLAVAGALMLYTRSKAADVAARSTLRQETIGRYQSAVELLNDDPLGSRTAGAALLAQLAMAEPGYQGLCWGAVAMTAAETSASKWQLVAEADSGEGRMLNTDDCMHHHTPFTAIALDQLGRMRRLGKQWVKRSPKHAAKLLVVNYAFRGRNYRQIDLQSTIFDRVTFVECDLRDSKLDIFLLGEVRFVDCDLRNATIKASRIKPSAAAFPLHPTLTLTGGKTKRTKLNDKEVHGDAQVTF